MLVGGIRVLLWCQQRPSVVQLTGKRWDTDNDFFDLRYLKQSYRGLQYDVNNLGTRFLSTCYSNFWWIPSKFFSTFYILSLRVGLSRGEGYLGL